MKLREFNKIIKNIMNKETKLLDKEKIKSIPEDIKDSMVKFIVKYRQPIVEDLIPKNFDYEWLNSMGYMYSYENESFRFLGNSEHYFKFKDKFASQ